MSRCHDFLLFKGLKIFHCMYIPHFFLIHSSMDIQVASMYLPKENSHLKRHMRPWVHCSAVYNSRDTEAIPWLILKQLTPLSSLIGPRELSPR